MLITMLQIVNVFCCCCYCGVGLEFNFVLKICVFVLIDLENILI